MEVLIFIIEKQRYALDLKAVARILLAVQYTTVPNSLQYVLGAINIHGQIVPVINMRQLLTLPSKDISNDDNYILCQVHGQKMALLVDRVERVKTCEEDISHNSSVQCILKDEEEITLFCDLEKLIPDVLVAVG